MTAFVRWLTHTHTQRWHAHRHSAGEGHVYQGRFKSFPIEKDEHLLTVLRYVERNALRADLVERAEAWRWGSLWVRQHGPDELRQLLSAWPVETPGDWVERVNRAQSLSELEALRHAVKRSSPYGSPRWVELPAKKLNLQWTLRPRGRPRVRPIMNKGLPPL